MVVETYKVKKQNKIPDMLDKIHCILMFLEKLDIDFEDEEYEEEYLPATLET